MMMPARRQPAGSVENETRRKIMDAAEELFAENSYAGVSLRSIVAAAAVNLAAIHYHFGSKDALFEAVFARCAQQIVDARMAALQAFRSQSRLPTLEEVLDSFLRPVLRPDPAFGPNSSAYARLRGRIIAENTEFGHRLQAKYFDESSKEYLRLINEIIPDLPKVDLYWRFHFLSGSMVYLMADVRRIEQLSDGLFKVGRSEEPLQRLVEFFADGFRIPSRAGRASAQGRVRARAPARTRAQRAGKS